MKFGFPGGPRLEWYDRNPVAKHYASNPSSVAPHSATVRWIYTVPSGKKAFISILQAGVTRQTAATTLGQAYAAIYLTISAVSDVILAANLNDNTVGAKNVLVASGGVLNAGDSIYGQTMDISTGGTCMYNVNYYTTEFNA